MDKTTKILIWIIGLIILAYIIFVPFEIGRKKPTQYSPKETQQIQQNFNP